MVAKAFFQMRGYTESLLPLYCSFALRLDVFLLDVPQEGCTLELLSTGQGTKVRFWVRDRQIFPWVMGGDRSWRGCWKEEVNAHFQAIAINLHHWYFDPVFGVVYSQLFSFFLGWSGRWFHLLVYVLAFQVSFQLFEYPTVFSVMVSLRVLLLCLPFWPSFSHS